MMQTGHPVTADPEQKSIKTRAKTIAARLMRPGLAPTNAAIEQLNAELTLLSTTLTADVDRAQKMQEELTFWKWLILEGGDKKQFKAPFAKVFGKWQRERIDLLGEYLGDALDGHTIDGWCAKQKAVEIGGGPFPALAAAPKWLSAIATDPLSRAYVEEGLAPDATKHISFLAVPGENIPLPTGTVDLIIIENCLDHVDNPVEVIAEMERLLKPGGYIWFFVDLSTHKDAMHPHPMTTERVHALFDRFALIKGHESDHKAHPEAYGSYRALWQRPPLPPLPQNPS